MNKEVKYLIEQLEEMRDYPTHEEEYIVENLVMLNYNKCKLLLDYINQLETNIDEAIAFIENDYYTMNTIHLDSIGYTTNKFLKVRNILKRGKE